MSYQFNPLLVEHVSTVMLISTKRNLNNVKAKAKYHQTLANKFGKAMADMVEEKGALMTDHDKVVFASLRKSQRYHGKKADEFNAAIEPLTNELNDIRLSMGLVR